MGNVLRSLWSSVLGSRFITSEEIAGRSTESSQLTDGVKQISKSVYLLYSPKGKLDWDAEIIFFHGLSVDNYPQAWWKTWLSTDGKVLWPKDWLTLQCKTSRMLAVTYNSRATLKREDPKDDMYTLGENLVKDIIHDARCGQETARPVILVGHCLGGIMIKQFILSTFRLRGCLNDKDLGDRKKINEINNFLSNFKGVFYYSTPNGGSREIENWAKQQVNPSPLVKLMQVLGNETQRINQDFRQLRLNNRRETNAQSYAICESCVTKTEEFNGLTVPEASARQDCDRSYTSAQDHFTVCKARDERDFTVIGKLVYFTKDILEQVQPKLKEERKLDGNKEARTDRPSVTSMAGLEDIKQINDVLYELYSPPEHLCEAELIFFHGLSVGESKGEYEEAYLKSWLSTDGKVLWPKDWLKLKAPTAKVFSVSYKSSASLQTGDSRTFDMYNYGENLVGDIIFAECGQTPGRPVILVGHCLGGIIIKQFILSAFKMKSVTRDTRKMLRIQNFLNNLKGVYFYSVPNGGSEEITKFAKTLKNPSPLLKGLQVLSTGIQRINEEFRALRDNHLYQRKVMAGAICENRATYSRAFHGYVVLEGSARMDMDEYYIHTDADHFTVCQARHEKDFTVIGRLATFTNDRIKDAQEEQRLIKLKSPSLATQNG